MVLMPKIGYFYYPRRIILVMPPEFTSMDKAVLYALQWPTWKAHLHSHTSRPIHRVWETWNNTLTFCFQGDVVHMKKLAIPLESFDVRMKAMTVLETVSIEIKTIYIVAWHMYLSPCPFVPCHGAFWNHNFSCKLENLLSLEFWLEVSYQLNKYRRPHMHRSSSNYSLFVDTFAGSFERERKWKW